MKRSVLILLSVITFSSTLCIAANRPATSRATSLEGAIENAIDDTKNQDWCHQHPEECRIRKEQQQEADIQREQREDTEAYCERNPWRCEGNVDQRERYKYCQRYPWKCKD